MRRLLIVDGYTDEPAGLGVPPYVGTYPRILAGAARELGLDVFYITVDDLRAEIGGVEGGSYEREIRIMNRSKNAGKVKKLIEKSEIIAVIAGIHTPGRYLSAYPGSVGEIMGYLGEAGKVRILGGPAAFGSQLFGGKTAKKLLEGFDYVSGDPERALWYHFRQENRRDTEWYVKGAFIVEQMPRKRKIAEIELGRGCLWGRCSFCTEGLRYGWENRSVGEVVEEVQELMRYGVGAFRLGRISDFFSYKFRKKPNVEAIKKLLRGIARLKPEVLHIDNADPHIIAGYNESEEIVKLIVEYCTPANVAALGMETADERVAKLNKLNTQPEEVMRAIKIINRWGGKRRNGLPAFLPGINFVLGLKGETRKTLRKNLEFLMDVLERGLLIRRVNIREVAIFEGTEMWKVGRKYIRKNRRWYYWFRRKVRREIDRPMLEKVFPRGTRFRILYEVSKGNVHFGRWLGSYPIVVGFRGRKPEFEQEVEVEVAGHGERSVEGRVVEP